MSSDSSGVLHAYSIFTDREKALAYAEMLVEDQDDRDLRQATLASVRRVDLRETPRAATVAVDSVSSPGGNAVISLMPWGKLLDQLRSQPN
jgi:hypothetical protein